jgi:anti-sigma factor RsiW
MTGRDRPVRRRATGRPLDPLDEALRQIGAELLDEPVPERLLRALRQARGTSDAEPDPVAGKGSRGADGR